MNIVLVTVLVCSIHRSYYRVPLITLPVSHSSEYTPLQGGGVADTADVADDVN